MATVKELKKIITRNQKKINVLINLGFPLSKEIANLHNEITLAEMEILNKRNKIVQAIFNKK